MDSQSIPSILTVRPEVTILENSPALHSWKRQQLIRLCKQFNLKANGKNVDLIERLKQHGKDVSAALALDRSVDGSNTSWDLVSETDVPDQNDLEEFGLNQASNVQGLSTSGSNSSIASTTKSARTAVFKKFTQPSHQPATSSSSSIYPSPQEAYEKYPLSAPENGEKNQREEEEDHNQTLEDFDHSVEGAIRRVPTHITANTSIDTASSASPLRPPIPPSPFVFGSPIFQQTPYSSFNFELSMPGSLLSLSTTLTLRGGGSDEGRGDGMRGTQVSILEEMNRRALESRKEAEKSGISLAKTSERGLVLASTNGRSPEKGKKEEEFDGKHKRVFDKMDSITNHYAAKRPHPSHNSSSTLAKSSSSKTLSASLSERPLKRIKPSIATSTSSRNLVSALRDSGWSSQSKGTTKVEKVSLKESIRGAANSLSEGSFNHSTALDSFREGREKEREMRKRKLELARARRKSGVQGTRKRRSTVVGSKHSESVSSTASSFLKSTFERFTASSSTSTTASSSKTPRFAIPTASSSSRAGLVPSSSIRSNLVSSTTSRTLSSSAINSTSSSSPKKKKGEPASSSLSSKPSTLARSKSNASLLSPAPPPPSLSRQNSARVANPTLLTAAQSPSLSVSNQPSASVPEKESIVEKLASLPSAPTTPFSNLSNNSVKSKGAATTQSRKLVSSTTKKARSGKSQTATKIEGLETKARKIRAVRRGGANTGSGSSGK
ncbi:hypothetical protein JCM5350_002163 [Sporobolomyces pararoseus]